MDTKARTRIENLIRAVNQPTTYVMSAYWLAFLLPSRIRVWIQVPVIVLCFVVGSHYLVLSGKALWFFLRRGVYRKKLARHEEQIKFWQARYLEDLRDYVNKQDHFDPEVRELALKSLNFTAGRLVDTLTENPFK